MIQIVILLDTHSLNWKNHCKNTLWNRAGYFYYRKTLVGYCCGIANCFSSCLCASSLVHMWKSSKNLSSFHTTIHSKLIIQEQTLISWTNSLSLKERVQILSLSSPSSHVSTTQHSFKNRSCNTVKIRGNNPTAWDHISPSHSLPEELPPSCLLFLTLNTPPDL